jgi:hypothetical protein
MMLSLGILGFIVIAAIIVIGVVAAVKDDKDQ